MNGITANFGDNWNVLSSNHERLQNEIERIFTEFKETNEIPNSSFLITGFFGSGKSSLLFYIADRAIKFGVLPIFVLAEDIFSLIHENDTPRDVDERIEKFVRGFSSLFTANNEEKLREVVNSNGHDNKAKIIQKILEVKNKLGSSFKTVLLVDELEDRYKELKNKVGNDPLRRVLQNNMFLKFFALTPTGVYDIGNADETRFEKWNIPTVDINYMREKYIQHGFTYSEINFLWWISRGIPRHIIKNLSPLQSIKQATQTRNIKDILKTLPRIGKHPGIVNAINLDDKFQSTKIKSLIDLSPKTSTKQIRGFILKQEIEDDRLSSIFNEFFNIQIDELALEIAYYFILTASSLADEEFISYIPKDQINDFFNLSLDILLQNEHEKPVVKDNHSVILNIRRKLNDDPEYFSENVLRDNDLKGIEYSTNIPKHLIFTIEEIRNLFIFPIVSPTIFRDPTETEQYVINKQKPISKDVGFLSFLKCYDFEKYFETKEFKTLVFPENNSITILLPEDEFNGDELNHNFNITNEKLIDWLIKNGKISFIKMPNTITLFIKSMYEESFPFSISEIEERIENQKDLFLVKKFELYYGALKNILEDKRPKPKQLLNDNRPHGEDNIWGVSQISNDDLIVPGLALAFDKNTENDKTELINLRNLFKTDGTNGYLHYIIGRGGLPTLTNKILPEQKKGLETNSLTINSLSFFLGTYEKGELEKLSRLVTAEDFVLLSENPNNKRILKAFWGAVKSGFDNTIPAQKIKLTEIIKNIENIISTSKKCQKVNIKIIYPNEIETFISNNSKLGLSELKKMSFSNNITKHIYQLYLTEVINKSESSIRDVSNKSKTIAGNLKMLKANIEKFKNEINSKKQVLKFLEDKISSSDILKEIDDIANFKDEEIELNSINKSIQEKTDALQTYFRNFQELDRKINDLQKSLIQ